VIAMRPLCVTCFRQPREPGSARCSDCGPGRIRPVRPPARPTRPLTPMDHAAELLGDNDINTEENSNHDTR
jgi:hypothetical protein